jgi:hypothetical protein
MALVLGGCSDDAPAAAPVVVEPTPDLSAPIGTGLTGSDQDFDAFIATFGAVFSYTAEITVETLGQPSIGATTETVLPDRFHVTITGGTDLAFEMIVVGAESYVKVGESWRKAASQTAAPVPPYLAASAPRDFLRDATVGKGGLSRVGDVDCQLYLVSIAGERTAEFCIGLNDRLPRQFVSREGATTLTILYSDFNAPLEIEAPR